ncbi:tetratricopeptide repeat protein [Acinetobacter shaoyimingii]|uniref:Sel1 repeat family protein n=1 Tax=Acinetobacter shaoyimingii TaxID=2715164 RepID=A0A6G8RY51_9GAMM|nr:tetratricopeptide repeat protein [Acinetobacter shaoyimingii]NHB58664.1 sel1 repeat family protein [Acinetobacter shaoyimingii]QIO06795.1 sel1 repeat family protein [Acinetobacter shaoyimingii]
MKKTLCALLVTLSSMSLFAEAPAVDPAFSKVQQLIQAKDFTNAYKELEQLSKAGNSQATYNLAYLTQTGQGTKQDNKKAVELYQQAGNKGYPIANYVLAQNYASGGLGLTKDAAKARQYLEKASSQGFDDATVELAVILFAEGKDSSDKQALQKLDPLIKKGNYAAIHAKALYDISQGFKTKKEAPVKQGLASIQSLAQKGYIPALMAAGNMYVNGNIVPQNLPEAKKIFEALSKQNIPQAKESLDVVNKLLADQAKNPPKPAPNAKAKS